MKRRLWWLIVMGLNASPLQAGDYNTISLQYISFAPNAGGQFAYAIRWAHNDSREYSLFSNQFLNTGKYPLSGAIYSIRFPLCPRCVVSTSGEIGAGLTNAGPMIELDWNLTVLWVARIDFATHLYFPTVRAIAWSYPLWLGITVPF